MRQRLLVEQGPNLGSEKYSCVHPSGRPRKHPKYIPGKGQRTHTACSGQYCTIIRGSSLIITVTEANAIIDLLCVLYEGADSII